jgi:hypothetical protein
VSLFVSALFALFLLCCTLPFQYLLLSILYFSVSLFHCLTVTVFPHFRLHCNLP